MDADRCSMGQLRATWSFIAIMLMDSGGETSFLAVVERAHARETWCAKEEPAGVQAGISERKAPRHFLPLTSTPPSQGMMQQA